MNRTLSRRAIFVEDKGEGGVEEIARASGRVSGRGLEEPRRKRRREQNKARSMAIYLCRMLGGHKHGEIGKVLGLEKDSSVSSVCLRMKARVKADKKIGWRTRRIEEEHQKS